MAYETQGLDPRLARELEELEMDYMELHERGDYPSLEELIDRYPGPENGEMRARIAEFVLDFVSLEAAAARVELSEEGLWAAEEASKRAIRRCLGYDPEDPEDADRYFAGRGR